MTAREPAGQPNPSEPVIEVDDRSLCSFLAGLFERLAATPDEELSVNRIVIGGSGFTIRASNPQVLAHYLDRLVGIRSDAPAAGCRLDVVAADELGWPSARWVQPDWKMHVFDRIVTEGGYRATYPYFDRQWIVADRRSGDAAYFLDSMKDRLPWDSGAPFRLPLHWALLGGRRRMVHAGSLGTGGEGVLIVGPGGAGKSGTTLAGLAAGMTTVGDDYVLLDQEDRPTALPLYRILKQDAKGLARIPGALERIGDVQPNWQGKFEFDPAALFPEAMAERLALRAIFLPVISGQDRSTLEPVARRDAVPYLDQAMFHELPADPAHNLLFLTGLTLRLPVFRLMLSSDPLEIGAAIRDFIEARAG